MAKQSSKKSLDSARDLRPATTMEELLVKSGSLVKGFKKGEKIKAKLIEIGPKFAIFDVGGKSEGILFESYFAEARDLVSTLKPGDIVDATVMEPETADGTVLLSLRHAANDMFWDNLEKAEEDDLVVTVLVRSANTRGLGVEIDGLSAFIPSSQVGKKNLENLDSLIGQRIKAKVLEIDKSKRRVLLSEKAVSEEKEIRLTQAALENVVEGEIYDGVVTVVTPFGAFVKINIKSKDSTIAIEGLVHVSELSWQKVKDPSEIVTEGDKIKVNVIGKKDGKVALSVKHATADPWTKVGQKYKQEQRFKGKVVRSSDFGTFVELEPGVEGLVHITKIPPTVKLIQGSAVDVYIEEVDSDNRKISLGLVLTSKPVGYK